MIGEKRPATNLDGPGYCSLEDRGNVVLEVVDRRLRSIFSRVWWNRSAHFKTWKIQIAVHKPIVSQQGLVLSSYLRFEAGNLPSVVGSVGENHVLRSNGTAGFLSFGPYISLEPGPYIAGFYIRQVGVANDNGLVIDAIVNNSKVLANKRHPVNKLFDDLSSFVFVSFVASEPLQSVEVRLFVEEGVVIEAENLTIFRSDERSWKSQ